MAHLVARGIQYGSDDVALPHILSREKGSDADLSLCPFLCPYSFKIDRNEAQRIAVRRLLIGA
jgi:hypothetical protein